MQMIMEDDLDELNWADYTTNTTSSSEDDHGCNWNDWSPLVDWEAFSSGQDDFNHLMDSMMDESVALHHQPSTAVHDDEAFRHVSPDAMMTDDEESNGYEDSKGLRLVHLLMAAAEALTGLSNSRDLARVILVRLKELVSPTDGTNMERLAAYFTEALQGLLEGAGGVRGKNILGNGPHHHQADVLAAFQLLQDMSPYVKFGHFTANQAILEAVTHDRRVHIVDYDIMEGVQWASLMQALVSRKDGPPSPHLRITALCRGRGRARGGSGSGARSISTVQETGRRLINFAASIGQSFSFHQCRLDSDEIFKPSALKLVRGEALVFNCILHLPHFSYRTPNSVASFLYGAKTLNPRLVTLVEEEMEPTTKVGFVGRFMESLDHYSALYDSLEAGFPMQRRAQALIERVFLGPQIATRIYCAHRVGEEKGYSWGNWLGGERFRGVNISFANRCQAKLLLGLFNDGYRVEESASNKLILGWKCRRLLSASIWTCPDLNL